MDSSRIWLDLSALFSGISQKSCIFLEHERLKTVRDVEVHISRVFDIKCPFYILNDGWLLPSSESSLLLRDNDTVSVIPQDDSKTPKLMDGTPKEVVSKSASSKNKPDSMRPVEPTISVEKRNLPQDSPEVVTVSMKNPFANPDMLAVHSSKTTSVTKPSVKHEVSNGHSSTAMDDEEDNNTSCGNNGEQQKRKRIRRRKKKSSHEKTEEPKPKQSRYIMNKFFQGVSHILNTPVAAAPNKKHIFFPEGSEQQSCDIDTSASITPAVSQEAPTPPSHNSSVVVENDLSKLMSLGNQKSPVVFERKKVDIAKVAIARPDTTKDITSETRFIPLKDMPVKESVIKFKVWKMVNYSPTISDFIIARVISPDFATNQIYAQIKEGLNEFVTDKGKFSLEEEDEEGMSVPDNPYKFLNWQDLIEPMIMEYC